MMSFKEKVPTYVIDTDGSESKGKDMPGLAILLFAAKKTKSATDDNVRQVNTGTDNFITRLTQSI
jgi:hypothetical protein